MADLKWSKYVKRNDLILLSLITVFVVGSFVIQAYCMMNKGSTIEIEVNGKSYGQYSLAEDQEIPILIDQKEVNTLVIESGAAYMKAATCPDHLCVKQGAISGRGQSIVCLPHRVIVTVTGGDEAEMDSMAK